jgi:hypothetical protein
MRARDRGARLAERCFHETHSTSSTGTLSRGATLYDANLWRSFYGTRIMVPGAAQDDDEPSHRSPGLINTRHA